MTADAATVQTPQDVEDLTKGAISRTFDFVRAAAADPDVLDEISNGATLILIPADDPDAAAEIEQGIAAVHRGEDTYFRHVTSASEIERVWAKALELDRRYRDIWERQRNGESTTDQAVAETLALLDRSSLGALTMATRRLQVSNTTQREKGGEPESPAVLGILALLDEMSSTLGAAGSVVDSRDFEQRMMVLISDLRSELAQ